jgi:hypothetical protein
VDAAVFESIACDLQHILADVIEEAVGGCGIEDVCVDVHFFFLFLGFFL